MARDDYLEPYRQGAVRHGTDFEVTLWANQRSQQLRFKVMARMVDFAGKRLLDAGCSRGDFAAYLLEHGIAFQRFIGVDGLPDVVDFANARSLANCAFHAGDFVRDPSLLRIEDPHIITISGSLNTMTDKQALAVLDAAWQACGEALMFNFLSDRCGPRAVPQQYPARRLPTMTLLNWALDKTPLVVYRQDYFPHGHDGTVLMRRA